MKLTATSVRSVTSPRTIDLVDARYPGLVLRVTAAGTKTWRLRGADAAWSSIGYAAAPAARRAALPVLTLAEVLDIWRTLRTGRLDDPAARLAAKITALERELEATRAAAGYGLTVAELADAFDARYSARNHSPRYRREVRRMLARDVLPDWGARPAAAIRQVDVAAVLHAVVDRGAPIQANRLLRAICRLYGWGTSVGLVPANPAAALESMAPENARETVLEDDEVVAVWRALEVQPSPCARALLMCAATLQRRQEVASMRWAALRERPWWVLAAGETKAGRQHRVHLVDAALELLEVQEPARFVGPYVFPGRGAEHVHPDAMSHAFAGVVAELRAAGKVRRRYTVHDLRRTGRTTLSRLGIAPHVGDRVLNHATSGVRRHYDLYQWDGEVKEALEAWGHHLWTLLAQPARLGNGR